MENSANYIDFFARSIWSPPLLILFIGTGVYLTFLLRGMQFRYLFYAVKQVFLPQKEDAKGDISHFEALMTSLAGAIGTGSIVGVATAVTLGGFGALFWMWVTTLFSMATKYAESLMAVKYRVVDKRGEMVGGPMEYIERGLKWKGLAVLFAVFGCVAAITTGNLVQANAIAEAVQSVWHVTPWVSGAVIVVLTSLVVIGGVRSIGQVAGILVPFMAVFYVCGGLFILAVNFQHIPAAFGLIFKSAFSGQAAVGGFLGATVMTAVQMGVSRSVFSNEAGFGISSIAAAAAKTDNPGRQAMITMTGALLSTVVVCTITGLVIAVTGTLGMETESGKTIDGASLAIAAFSASFGFGKYIVSIGLILFAFSTIIAWAYYGEKCSEYLFGEKAIYFYRVLFVGSLMPGAICDLHIVWGLADIANGLMSIPNLVALIGLSGAIQSETRDFLQIADKECAPYRTVDCA